MAAVRMTFVATVLLLALVNAAQARATTERLEVSTEEYPVYNAVLDIIKPPKDDLYVLIFPKTMSFGCEKWQESVPLANGCSFLAFPPSTPEQIEQLLESEWSQLSRSMWTDFKRQNAASAYLRDSFVTSWKHELAPDPDVQLPNESKNETRSPDFVLILSRVGFSPKKNEAIVCVVLFSYMDRLKTGGDYFLLHLSDDNHWVIRGRVRYFELNSQDDDSK